MEGRTSLLVQIDKCLEEIEKSKNDNANLQRKIEDTSDCRISTQPETSTEDLMHDNNQQENHNTTNISSLGYNYRSFDRHRNKSNLMWAILLLAILPFALAINLGPVYDCTKTTPMGNYRLPTLEINDKRLVTASPRIPCDQRSQHTYLEDIITHDIYEVSANGHVRIQELKSEHVKATPDNPIPMLRGYDERMVESRPQKLEPYSVLQIMSETHETIQTLQVLSDTQGGGDVLTGIGKGLGASLNAVAGAGNTIIRSLGSAIHDGLEGFGDMDEKIISSIGSAASDILTAGGGAIKNAGEGVGGFFGNILGGISGSIVWGVIIVIICYLFITNPTIFAKLPCVNKSKPSPTRKTDVDVLPDAELQSVVADSPTTSVVPSNVTDTVLTSQKQKGRDAVCKMCNKQMSNCLLHPKHAPVVQSN